MTWKGFGLLVASLSVTGIGSAGAEEAQTQPAQEKPKPRMDIYGFAMLDMGYDAGQTDPDWFDVVRPTKLPAFEDEFGKDGNFYAGVRQSRLGVKSYLPTSLGELKTTFEFELFGTGVDAGQTWSPFMDPDVFPKSVEYWGPTGMVFFRNVQVRFMPLQGATSVTLALERPGASADQGVYADRIELQDIKARFPAPDVSGNVKRAGAWGHVQVAGIYRRIQWDDLNEDQFALSGSANGWGINTSTNLKIQKDTIRASLSTAKESRTT